MKIHNILPISKANGPGARFVIWTQGCRRQCSDCFNPATHDPNGGCEIGIMEIIKQIPKEEVCGITVSGGEPFEQAEELAIFLEQAGQNQLNRLVYTGFTCEELAAKNDITINKCLSFIDILIDGHYTKDVPSVLPWTGSGNQRILQLKHGKIINVYEKSDFDGINENEGEIIIGFNGSIIATGIFNSSPLL